MRDDERLGVELRALGAALGGGPDVAGRVRARIVAADHPRAARRFRPALAVAMALVLVAALSLVIVPSAREAVADLLGIGGVKVRVVDRPPPTPLGEDLALGTATTLEEAERRVGFDLLLPTEVVGEPDDVYVSYDRTYASFVWRAGPELPRATSTGVGLLLMEFPGRIDEPSMLKKVVGAETSIEVTQVNGAKAYWISGGPHALFYRDNGSFEAQEGRLADNALIWERDGITYRLESSLPIGTVLDIANSMR